MIMLSDIESIACEGRRSAPPSMKTLFAAVAKTRNGFRAFCDTSMQWLGRTRPSFEEASCDAVDHAAARGMALDMRAKPVPVPPALL